MSLLIDVFAHEYNWGVEWILELPITGVMSLVKRISARYPKADDKQDGIISVDQFDNLMRIE